MNRKGQWSGQMGEKLVERLLQISGHHCWRPSKRGGHRPDWETRECVVEVKTRRWTVSGTAGEKVLSVAVKYGDVPTLYHKPLKIILVAARVHACRLPPVAAVCLCRGREVRAGPGRAGHQ